MLTEGFIATIIISSTDVSGAVVQRMDADLISLILLLSAIAMYQLFMRRKLNLMMMNKTQRTLRAL